MIRDGRMPTPEEAERLRHERIAERWRKLDAWEHPERLYEAVADVLELWKHDPNLARSNSFRRLQDELSALVEGASRHFEIRISSEFYWVARSEKRNKKYQRQPALIAEHREALAYAEEHLARAFEIPRTINGERQ